MINVVATKRRKLSMLEFTFLSENGKSSALVFIHIGDWLTQSHREQLTVHMFNTQRAQSHF